MVTILGATTMGRLGADYLSWTGDGQLQGGRVRQPAANHPRADRVHPDDPDAMLRAAAAMRAGVGITVLEVEGPRLTMVWVNERFTDITGRSMTEVVGREPREFFGERWDVAAFTDIARRVRAGEAVEVTLPFRRPEGDRVWLRLRLTSALEGRPEERSERWVATFDDVTDAMARDESLQVSITQERRARESLALLVRISRLLTESDESEVLGVVSAVLASKVASWAGFLLVDNHLEVSAGVDPFDLSVLPARGARAEPPEPPALGALDRSSGGAVLHLLGGRLSDAIVDLSLGYPEGSAAYRVQQAVLGDDPTLVLRAPRVRVIGIPGSRSVLGLCVVAPPEGVEPENLDDDVRTLLDVIVRRVALAVENARLHAREHQLASALQRAMLPEQADVPGLDVWSYYSPNVEHAQVGGDWYDIIGISDEVAGIVIGDVVGHDVEAAAVMGQLRSVVRAYSFELTDPALVLERTDELVRRASSTAPSRGSATRTPPRTTGAGGSTTPGQGTCRRSSCGTARLPSSRRVRVRSSASVTELVPSARSSCGRATRSCSTRTASSSAVTVACGKVLWRCSRSRGTRWRPMRPASARSS